MKNKLFSTILIITSYITVSKPAFAQAPSAQSWSSPVFTIGITGGASIPMGNFSKTDYYNAASGFAGSGSNFGITGTWYLGRKKHWGITELFSYQHFGFSGGQNIANGMQSFPDGFDVDSVTFGVRGSNHTFNFLVGPSYTINPNSRLNVAMRLLVGFVNASLAGNNITLTDGGITDPTFYQAVSWANSFGGQVGVGLRYNITHHVGIGVNADFFYSKPDFEVNNINRNNSAGREIYSYNQPVEGVNANLTLFYSISRMSK